MTALHKEDGTMRSKIKTVGKLACGVAVSALALTPLTVQAQDTMAGGSATTMVAPTGTDPILATGTIVRYYVDRSGYVSAMDVQTGDGIQMIHFPPNLGQRLYSNFQVGGKISAWVTPSYMGTGHWNAVAVGDARPSAFMTPYHATAIDLLEATPEILIGAKMTTVNGKLARMVVNSSGEVLALVLDNGTVVRIPRELRQISAGYAGSERVTPLFKGARVTATGYPEAPRYGSLSPYGSRVIASAITVNAKSVGALGFPIMDMDAQKALFKADIGGATLSNEELSAAGMGYSVYNPTGAGGGAMIAPAN